ncbi:ABC transporter ATP-binding protein [Breznakiella homolactica]|uniref:Multidrug resistance-like ATP-binding protein MdlA n=1 Tax=Breznakiella homolactica TaxID=2798577 RepID=A0A7T7XLG5_9SPIR|nr:ABC transporter ATP-binding protein [Breznakiella homolactica]QQO08551.1 ABC transporter ATP-binding protein/permease [Breznakiella homolactica]
MQKASLKEFRSLIPYLSRYRWRYVLGFLCLIIVDVAQIFIPQCIRQAVDLISSGRFNWHSVLVICGVLLGIALVISLGRFLWRFFIHGSSRRIETELRDKLFSHLLTLSYDFYQKNKIGDLMARGTNDINAVRMSIGMGLVALIDGTVMASAILVIMFMQDARTAALAIIPLPLITILILFFGSAVGKRFRRAQETYSSMSDTVQETFAGIRVIKSFVKEWWFIKKFADTNDDYKDANMALVKIFGVFFPLISFLSGLTTLILLLVGGQRVVEGLMSPGELVALFSYLQMLIWPMLGAGFMVNMIQRGATSLMRVNEILNTKPSITSPDDPVKAPAAGTVSPAIELRDLTFAYPGGGPVLRDISLAIPRGAMVGILGKTGSGKSTMLKALVRLVDPPEGTVFAEGVDVRLWDLKELRGRFGMTPQDSYLFSDSIKNNISYGAARAGEEQIHKAAELSSIDRDLESFSVGWDTLIGERGLTLSGGQKQRVAISRALVRDPEFLVLDDSLSAVDAETERRILNMLLANRRGKTTLIVSHRVSTLHNADQVIVLDQGRVSEYGTPQELISRGGFYSQMAELQQLEQAGEGDR